MMLARDFLPILLLLFFHLFPLTFVSICLVKVSWFTILIFRSLSDKFLNPFNSTVSSICEGQTYGSGSQGLKMIAHVSIPHRVLRLVCCLIMPTKLPSCVTIDCLLLLFFEFIQVKKNAYILNLVKLNISYSIIDRQYFTSSPPINHIIDD